MKGSEAIGLSYNNCYGATIWLSLVKWKKVTDIQEGKI
jgi:hypothetical protein